MGVWIWCWNQDAIIAVDWENVSLTKKSTDESAKDEGIDGFFFYWKGIVHQEFVPRGQM